MRDRKEVLLDIKNFSINFYSQQDFAHNIIHGERVVKNAKKIMENEGGDDFIVDSGV